MTTKIIKIGLCAGRHSMPVDDYIFPEDFFDNVSMFDWYKLRSWCGDVFYTTMCSYNKVIIHIYVTGFTPALTAALDYLARFYNAYIALHHYNKDTHDYEMQLWDISAWLRLFDSVSADDASDFAKHISEILKRKESWKRRT